MNGIVASAGEKVTDVAGNVICTVKNDIHRHSVLKASDFHNFTDGNLPWQPNMPVDRRCVRSNGATGGMQICINGEWRP